MNEQIYFDIYLINVIAPLPHNKPPSQNCPLYNSTKFSKKKTIAPRNQSARGSFESSKPLRVKKLYPHLHQNIIDHPVYNPKLKIRFHRNPLNSMYNKIPHTYIHILFQRSPSPRRLLRLLRRHIYSPSALARARFFILYTHRALSSLSVLYTRYYLHARGPHTAECSRRLHITTAAAAAASSPLARVQRRAAAAHALAALLSRAPVAAAAARRRRRA